MDHQALADRLEIAELLARYARGIDTNDWAVWRDVFVPDAYIDYRSAGGVDGTRDEVGAWLETTFAMFSMSQHAISNIECHIDGDTAKVRALFHNPMQFEGVAGVHFFGGFYHHQLIRTADGWRSRELVEETSWHTDPPAAG